MKMDIKDDGQLEYYLDQIWFLERKIERLQLQLQNLKICYQKDLIKKGLFEMPDEEIPRRKPKKAPNEKDLKESEEKIQKK